MVRPWTQRREGRGSRLSWLLLTDVGSRRTYLSPMQPTPNSKDWLEALEKINPMQEAQGAELSLVD